MYLYCARIYIGGAKLPAVRKYFPRARKIGRRVYVGYDNASGEIYSKANQAAGELGGYVESEAD